MAESGAYKDEKSENSRPNENSDHSDIEVTQFFIIFNNLTNFNAKM